MIVYDTLFTNNSNFIKILANICNSLLHKNCCNYYVTLKFYYMYIIIYIYITILLLFCQLLVI